MELLADPLGSVEHTLDNTGLDRGLLLSVFYLPVSFAITGGYASENNEFLTYYMLFLSVFVSTHRLLDVHLHGILFWCVEESHHSHHCLAPLLDMLFNNSIEIIQVDFFSFAGTTCSLEWIMQRKDNVEINQAQESIWKIFFLKLQSSGVSFIH